MYVFSHHMAPLVLNVCRTRICISTRMTTSTFYSMRLATNLRS
eukprot:SAG25_NODE_1023_length_4252_cov_3.280279_4_plen_43_part_00